MPSDMIVNGELVLYGTVGDTFWGYDYFTASAVRRALSEMSGDIVVRLNSGGGIASEGQAIYSALKDYPGKVTVSVDGVAASAASLLAMAGDEVVMRLGAWMLIHDPASPFTEGRGTADDHAKEARLLNVVGDAYAGIYAARAGITAEEAREIMRVETVYGPEDAVAAGFADHVEGQDAVEASAYHYHIYRNAPAALVEEAKERLGEDCPRKEAVFAMIAGVPRAKQEAVMSVKEPAVETAKADPVARPTIDVKAETEKAVRMERERASEIRKIVATAKLEMSVADQMVNDGVPLADARARVLEMWSEKQVAPVTAPAATVNVIRDERDTQRVGMEASLVAQITGKNPEDDRAKAFMSMSIVDMAAQCANWTGPIRSAGDRERVLMAGTHSTSDFPAIFENALNKVLLERYSVQDPTYRMVARRRDFNDFRPHPMVRGGDFPELQAINEAGEIKFGSFSENKETAVLTPYGVGLTITRQMMINDEMGAIDEILGDYGASVAHFEEKTFYAFFDSASTLLADGSRVFVAGHNNLAGSGTAITVAALGAARAAIRKQTTLDGQKVNIAPRYLLVGPDKETEADSIVAPITPDSAANVNVFSGRLTVVTSAHITGNTWYVFADPAAPGGYCFTYGYLQGNAAPRLRTEEPFGRQGMSMTLEHDFGLGAVDYRGAYKNAGA